MNKLLKKSIAILISTSMLFTSSICVTFAETSAAANSSSDAPVTPTITLKVGFTYKDHATNEKKLGEIVQKDNRMTATWHVDKPKAFTSYKLYRVKPSTDAHKLVATIKATKDKNYTRYWYASAGNYNYEIRGYLAKSDGKNEYVSSNIVEAPKVPGDLIVNPHVKINLWWTAKAKKNSKLFRKPGKKPFTTIKKGVSRMCTWKYAPEKFDFWDEPSWVQIHYKGKRPWIKWSNVEMNWHITHLDYSWTAKEKFVNHTHKGKSYSKYLIWVSRYTQRTNVFKKKDGKWRLIKVFDCNTGNYYQPLNGGQFYIKGHEKRKDKIHRDGREYYFLYSTKFGGSGSFHTRCRWSDTNNLRNSIKRHPTTKGCDRLYDEAAQYVYNLPIGTGVLIQ